MAERLVKRWNDWSAGVGYPIDDGQTPGMYNASGLLGLKGELRVAPKKNTVTVGIDESHHYQYFFEEPISASSPVWDASSTSQITNGNTVTWSHTVAAQSNRILIVFIAFENASAPTVVTYNGDNLTLFTSYTAGATDVWMYYIVAPDTGANNVVVTTADVGIDAKVGAVSFYSVNQTSPIRGAFSDTSASGAGPATKTLVSGTTEVVVGMMMTVASRTITLGAGQTSIFNGDNTGGDLTAAASYETGAASVVHSYSISSATAYAMIGGIIAGVPAGTSSYLYPIRGGRSGTTACAMEKIDLFNSSFATLEAGSHALTNLLKCGQPTRYQSFWWIPDGDEFDPRKLTVASGAVAADTLAASSAWTSGGADHLANMNGQMIAGLLANGFAILGVDGTPTTTADWGSYFKVGDKNERPAAISGLSGLSFVLTVEGLFSFNSQSRSGLVFEDFRSWRNVFDNIPMPAWRGGLLIPHPTGLLYYTPGELPVNVGIETKAEGMPASGVTELHGGRYMGVHATGDYIWAIYQPLLSSTNVLILCGYSQTGDPRQLTWQVMGTATLQDAQHLLGIFVSAQSQPLSSTYFTPTVWFGDNDDLGYHVLDQRAGPFRSRTDTHPVQTSAEAFMSEIEFPEPLNLTRLVVYTSEDRVSGDEWQISLIDQNGEDINVGAPMRSGSVRHERPINRHDISRLTLHTAFTGTSAASRVPPAIKRIELYGDLAIGSA